MTLRRRALRCPKCRSLGLTTDCTDLIQHARRGVAMNIDDDDDAMELEVTISFLTPVTSSLRLDPYEMATRMREQWIEEPKNLTDVVALAVYDDFDLQVKPVFL